MVRANTTTIDGVMKKCTLCIDRIYNENLEPEDRVPACVRACPTGARHFGDLGDPQSRQSRSSSTRVAATISCPRLAIEPVNKYLPPRPGRDATSIATRRFPRAMARLSTGSSAGPTGC